MPYIYKSSVICVITSRFKFVVGFPHDTQTFSYLWIPPFRLNILDGTSFPEGQALLHNIKIFIGEKFPQGNNISGGFYIITVDFIKQWSEFTKIISSVVGDFFVVFVCLVNNDINIKGNSAMVAGTKDLIDIWVFN